MVDNESIYFDTLIVNTLEIAQFRKKSIHSTNMMNFKQAIAPLQYIQIRALMVKFTERKIVKIKR